MAVAARSLTNRRDERHVRRIRLSPEGSAAVAALDALAIDESAPRANIEALTARLRRRLGLQQQDLALK